MAKSRFTIAIIIAPLKCALTVKIRRFNLNRVDEVFNANWLDIYTRAIVYGTVFSVHVRFT